MTPYRATSRTAPSVTTQPMISPRPAKAGLRVLGILCAGAFVLLAPACPALAQGKLEARYEATLAGIPIGKGAWTIDIAEDQFSAAASGGTSGLLKAFAGGSGTGASQGRVVNGALVATTYSASTTTSKKSEAVHMIAVERQCQGIWHRAGSGRRSRPDSGHRSASPRHLRSDDRLDAAGARHRRSVHSRQTAAPGLRSSTAACAMT